MGPVHPVGNFALPDTGYYGARSGQGHYVVCDAAPIGPDYLPGHAHGDIFSFELSLAGQRVVVDAGVHGYEADAMRRYCRSTRAHNTVEIDGEDQCEFWAAFRVARRGRPRDVAWREEGEGFSLEAWHDGYERLPGRPRHRRRFRWHSQGALLVRDRVEASRPVRSCSRLHLHPACEVRELTAAGALVVHPAGTFRVAFAGPGALSVDTSPRCSEFGREVEGRDLVYTSRGAQLDSGFALVHEAADLRYELAHGAVVGGARLPV